LPKEQAAKAAAQLWHDNPVDLRITTVSKSVRMDGFRVQDCLDYDKDLKWYLSKCDKPSAAKAEGSETSADEEAPAAELANRALIFRDKGSVWDSEFDSQGARVISQGFAGKASRGAGMVGGG